jgi:glycosyltransferase involved in cell wall biosynthesis
LPKLILVGRRGWEIENVIDMLERCPALKGAVEEYNDLPDHRLALLLRDARALLLPSFAEGYGLPLAEALAAGVPAICSDIPCFREVGGEVPEYLDPLDAIAWMEAIRDYTGAASPRRKAQLGRLATWHAPGWAEHFAVVDRLLEETAGEEMCA